MVNIETIEKELDEALSSLAASQQSLHDLEGRWSELQKENKANLQQLQAAVARAEESIEETKKSAEAWMAIADERIDAQIQNVEDAVSTIRREAERTFSDTQSREKELARQQTRDLQANQAQLEKWKENQAALLEKRANLMETQLGGTLAKAKSVADELEVRKEEILADLVAARRDLAEGAKTFKEQHSSALQEVSRRVETADQIAGQVTARADAVEAELHSTRAASENLTNRVGTNTQNLNALRSELKSLREVVDQLNERGRRGLFGRRRP